MSLQSVQQFFADNAPDVEIIELSQSTATVAPLLQRITLNRVKSPRRYR